MKSGLGVLLVLASTCLPAICQQQLDAATKDDVEQLLTLIGTRERVQQIWSAMAQQAAISAADSYRAKHPNASPAEVSKVAEATQKSIQASLQTFSVDELIDAIVPIYQQHLTHADVRGIIDFYNSSTGQKFLKEMPAMMNESMQSVQPIIKKHLPEMEAAAEKAAEDVAKSSSSNKNDSAGETKDKN